MIKHRMKQLINVLFVAMLICSFSLKGSFFDAEAQAAKKEAEELQAQYESYLLLCMQMTVNHGVASTIESGMKFTKNTSEGFQAVFRGPYAWLTADAISPIRDGLDSYAWLTADTISPISAEFYSNVKKRTSRDRTFDLTNHQPTIRTFFEVMIDKVNGQIVDQNLDGEDLEGDASRDVILKVDKKEKLDEFDALFESVDSDALLPAKEICEILDALFVEIDELSKAIKNASDKGAETSCNPLLINLFQSRLASSKKMLILKEFNERLEHILGLSKDGGFGEVRTIDTVLADLKELFSQEMCDELRVKKDEISAEVAAIKKSFERFNDCYGSDKAAKADKEELLKKYKELYKEASVSSQVLKKINDVIVMLEEDIAREDLGPEEPPLLTNIRLAECEWYLEEIPKSCKEWKDPWYASGSIVVPLTLFATFFGYLTYKGYRNHQDKTLIELKDKILFLNTLPRKERDQLLARLDEDLLIKYVPVELLSALDKVVDFFEIDHVSLVHFHKKIERLYQECLDKKEAELYHSH